MASQTLDILDEADAVLAEAATELSATIRQTRSFRDRRRRVLQRGGESLVVDLVRDEALQLVSDKPARGDIRLDPPEEIFANKLFTLLSRSELRDLVDVRALEQSGLPLERGLADAARKDAGLTPGTLSWILGQIAIGDDARIPGGVFCQRRSATTSGSCAIGSIGSRFPRRSPNSPALQRTGDSTSRL